MKKLNKNRNAMEHSIEAYGCICICGCSCSCFCFLWIGSSENNSKDSSDSGTNLSLNGGIIGYAL